MVIFCLNNESRPISIKQVGSKTFFNGPMLNPFLSDLYHFMLGFYANKSPVNGVAIISTLPLDAAICC